MGVVEDSDNGVGEFNLNGEEFRQVLVLRSPSQSFQSLGELGVGKGDKLPVVSLGVPPAFFDCRLVDAPGKLMEIVKNGFRRCLFWHVFIGCFAAFVRATKDAAACSIAKIGAIS